MTYVDTVKLIPLGILTMEHLKLLNTIVVKKLKKHVLCNFSCPLVIILEGVIIS